MNLIIKNRLDEGCSAEDFMHVKRELVRALADYLITNDLVKVEIVKGDLIITLNVKK